jgi:cyclopropane-fatty-acyl-phospholipid synthase
MMLTMFAGAASTLVTRMPIGWAAVERLMQHHPSLALVLPDGQRIGSRAAAVTLTLRDARVLTALLAGQPGRVARAFVEGRVDLDGSMRAVCDIAATIMRDDPTRAPRGGWLGRLGRALAARIAATLHHTRRADARQIEFHYDLAAAPGIGRGSDDFYGLWLDPRRVYSCAYFAQPTMTLAQAQEAKLALICRKLRLREGERLLDVGAGWGALLVWAATHHGVHAHGITLSRHQCDHVQRLIDSQGLRGRVSIELRDYRDLDATQPFDKIASVGMFEHVGAARLSHYFDTLHRLTKPGGLLLNHGITAGGTDNRGLGGGIGGFVQRHIFPGGELVHASRVLGAMARSGFEVVDVENLRPHYARTLWAWSDALEARIERARETADEATVRAYRVYLAGSAMAFERGWISLHQCLAARPSGNLTEGAMPGAQSQYPFNRDYMHACG